MGESAQVVNVASRHRYEVVVDGKIAGYVTYVEQDGAVVLEHTRIKVAFEGRGLGAVLVAGVLADIRERGLSVVALCPFVASWMQRNPQFDDLVDHALRERLVETA